MNLVKTQTCSAVKHAPHLWPAGQVLGECVNVKTAQQGFPYQCRARVVAGEGYADTEGTPWKAYYCPECVGKLLQEQARLMLGNAVSMMVGAGVFDDMFRSAE